METIAAMLSDGIKLSNRRRLCTKKSASLSFKWAELTGLPPEARILTWTVKDLWPTLTLKFNMTALPIKKTHQSCSNDILFTHILVCISLNQSHSTLKYLLKKMEDFISAVFSRNNFALPCNFFVNSQYLYVTLKYFCVTSQYLCVPPLTFAFPSKSLFFVNCADFHFYLEISSYWNRICRHKFGILMVAWQHRNKICAYYILSCMAVIYILKLNKSSNLTPV